MVAVSDFSGLTSSAWALANAEANAATVSLDRGIGCLRLQHIKAHRPRSRAFCPHPVSDRLLCVVGNEVLELALCSLVVEEDAARIAKQRCELRPGIGRARVNNTDCLDARPWRLGLNQVGRFT